jgi:hypothetical protein
MAAIGLTLFDFICTTNIFVSLIIILSFLTQAGKTFRAAMLPVTYYIFINTVFV